MTKQHDDLLARRMAGEDVGQGEPVISHEPMVAAAPGGEVKIGKSLRVPLPMFEQIQAVAQRRRLSWSALVREWITEGLARDEVDVDPVVEMEQHLTAATRALHALQSRQQAA